MMKLRPIVVDESGTILAGNTKYKALKHLGFKEIPEEWVAKASDLTEKQKKEFVIKDNTHAGDWDFEMLIDEWNEEDLLEWGVDNLEMPSFEEFEYTPNTTPQFANNQISQEQIDKKKEEIDSFFQKEKSHYTEMICPKCGHEFNVS